MAGRAWLVAGLCALAAAAITVVEIAGAPDPVRMPTAPPVVPILGAIGAILLVTTADRAVLSLGARAAVGTLCGAAMLAGSLLAIPHTLLIVIIWIGSRISGGAGPFEVTPAWPSTAAHLIAVVAVAMLGVWLVVERRRDRQRCLACGRVDPTPGVARWPVGPWLAALAVGSSLPYGLLKAAWALGWAGGLTGQAFTDVAFTSPGFGDTAVLTGVSVIVAVLMGARVSGRWVRPILLAVGVFGSLLLVPVAAVGAVSLVPVALGLTSIDDSEIAPWAFLLVYGSFLFWGGALVALTVSYWRATRPICRRHRLAVSTP